MQCVAVSPHAQTGSGYRLPVLLQGLLRLGQGVVTGNDSMLAQGAFTVDGEPVEIFDLACFAHGCLGFCLCHYCNALKNGVALPQQDGERNECDGEADDEALLQ